MRNKTATPLFTAIILGVLTAAHAETTIISDNYTVSGGDSTTTGFGLDEGVNTGINPPTTRLTGTTVADLRYFQSFTAQSAKAAASFDINNNRLRVSSDGGIGRFTLSADGATPFDFSSALGTLYASPTNPAIYELRISMRNNASGTSRFSFAIATVETDANGWDFGVQMYRAASGDNFYTIQRRIDAGSSGNGDINQPIGTTAPGTTGSLNPILIRITDAGTGSTDTQIQVSLDNGTNWVYDTSTDSTFLPNGFKFDGPGRVIIFDQAGNSSAVFYDSFSITSIYAPTPPADRVWTGGGTDDNWSTPANWGGLNLISGAPVIFDGTSRQTNNNDLLDLTALSLAFNNGGFMLNGNAFTNTLSVSNAAGVNVIGADLSWAGAGSKSWFVNSGSELVLNNNTSTEVGGDQTIRGGGALRVKGTMTFGQLTTANPAFIINEGSHVIDGGTFASRGGYRIGSQADSAGAQTIISNNATFNLTVSGANFRVGDSANPNTARLDVNNSMLTLSGGSLGIPYAAGATAQVAQVGGTNSGAIVNFSQSGAGAGVYGITNGTLEAIQIKKNTAAGLAQIYFNNATLRDYFSASNTAFFAGLNLAQIQEGGLVLDTQGEFTIDQVLSGAGALGKTGFGSVTLKGKNTYTGDTIIHQGRLTLPTIQTNATAVRVGDGADFGVAVQAPGTTLSVSSLTFTGASFATFTVDLGTFSTPTAPLMRVGTLTINGPVSVNVVNGQQLGTGQFVLVKYSGSIVGTYQFPTLSLPPGVSGFLSNNTANASVDLVLTGVPGLRWTGATDNTWDGFAQNWLDKQTSSPGFYSDAYPVEFLDGGLNPNINLTIFASPPLIVVSNNTTPYIWNNGAITTPVIKKSGNGSLTRVETSVDTITEIELNAGSFVASNEFTTTFSTLLTDTAPETGTFVKAGASVTTLDANNATYDGAVLVQQGVLKLGVAGALGTTNGGTTVASGATLDLNNLIFPGEPVTVSGSGSEGQGAIIDSTTATGVAHNLTDVTMTGDTVLGAPNGGRWDIRVRGSSGPGPGLRGNGYNLTKVGSGFVSIACQRSLGALTPYWEMNLGDITVVEGTLAIAESLSLGNPAKALTVNPGAVLQFFDLGVTNPILRNITISDARMNFDGGSTDTNVLNGALNMSGTVHLHANQGVTIFNGALNGAAAVNLSANGPGRAYFNGANGFTGDLTVTNATIGGVGSLAGNLVMLGGTNAPGMGVGTFTVNGNATLAGVTLMELDRNQSPNSDRLVVGGTLAFGGTLQVVLASGAPEPQAGDVYQLFNKGSGSTFSSVSLPVLTGGRSWVTTDLTVNGTISVTGPANPPVITNTVAIGNDLVISGTGGVQGNTYHLVSSTNVTLPSATWETNGTSTFGIGGTFSITNAIDAAKPVRFFRLSVP